LINIVTSFDRYILASMASTSQEHHLTAIKLTVSLYGRTWITVFSFGQTRVWFCPTTNLSITKLEFLVECSVHLHYHIEAKTTLLPSVTLLLWDKVKISIVRLTWLFRTIQRSIHPEDPQDHLKVILFYCTLNF